MFIGHAIISRVKPPEAEILVLHFGSYVQAAEHNSSTENNYACNHTTITSISIKWRLRDENVYHYHWKANVTNFFEHLLCEGTSTPELRRNKSWRSYVVV